MTFVYCHETNEVPLPWGFKRVGIHRQIFLSQALASLRTSLASKGQRLVECRGRPEVALPHLAEELGATLIFTEAIEAPYERDTIRKLEEYGIRLITIWQSSLIDPANLPFSLGQLPDVFTSFRHQVENSGITPPAALPAPVKLPAPPAGMENKSSHLAHKSVVSETNSSFPYDLPSFYGGEEGGLSHLKNYLKKRLPDTYKQTRNNLSGTEFSSKFSPWLAQGALSPRKVYEALKCYESQFGSNEGTYWLWFELLWRDYFRFLHLKYGRRLYLPTGLSGQKKPPHSAKAFEAWCLGETGQNLVDAGMRELSMTGYISNRMRQIVASFLVYDLQCDWRAGAAWFESQLIDYDVYSNQGNWLYIAGYGTDPRGGRQFNPDKQAKTYDPSGEYQAYWLDRAGYAQIGILE